MFFDVQTNALLFSHSINPNSATGGMTASLFSPNGAQLLTVIYNDFGFVLNTIDPPLGIKPTLATTGTNDAPVFIGAGILLVLGLVVFSTSIVIWKKVARNMPVQTNRS
jgi:hypothetical protein